MGAGGTKLAVLGAGNFGTVIANIVAGRGHEVALWVRDPAQCQALQETRENARYLPGHALHDGVKPTPSLEEATAGARLVFVAVPSAAVPEVALRLKPLIAPGTGLLSTTKGLARHGFRFMSEVLADACPQARIGVLSGPNIAEEIAQGHFTGTVIASPDSSLCEEVQAHVHSRSFRVYSNSDRYGVELAGALKNIYALASGMAAALGAGENSRAMLLTRGLAEMSQFAVAKGANGDVLVSPFPQLPAWPRHWRGPIAGGCCGAPWEARRRRKYGAASVDRGATAGRTHAHLPGPPCHSF